MKDNRGSLWFGNSDGTLTLYDGATGQFRLRSLQDKGRVNVAAVWALYMDADRCLWIGTNNGVWKLNTKSGVSQKISIEKAFKDSTKVHVRAIVGTKDGAIWLGTSNIGVCKLKLDSEGEMSIKIGYEKVANIKNSSVRSLLVSSDGNVYVGYMDGFAILSPKQMRYENTIRPGTGCVVISSDAWSKTTEGIFGWEVIRAFLVTVGINIFSIIIISVVVTALRCSPIKRYFSAIINHLPILIRIM